MKKKSIKSTKNTSSLPQTPVPTPRARASGKSRRLSLVDKAGLSAWVATQNAQIQAFIKSSGFEAAPGSLLTLPADKGGIVRILVGYNGTPGLYTLGSLPGMLPPAEGGYVLDMPLEPESANALALGWLLGSYRFDAYKTCAAREPARLVWPKEADQAAVLAAAEAAYLARDLINTPPNILGPQEIAAAGRRVARSFNKASVSVISGKDLLKKNYPLIYTVGKASPCPPCLIDLRWGRKGDPMVTVIGKGVSFDTGGLDIKPASAMALMKKDMGGAAHALGLAHMIMAANLPVQLRVLIPAVENSVSGNSFRTSDVVTSRSGITVEIGNTDAEGRVVMADAITEACREKPDLLIDFATLTGAARVALGQDLPAMFSNDDTLAQDLIAAAEKVEDPLWRMPLWAPYARQLDSDVADTSTTGSSGLAGAITAALFLEKFVAHKTPWIHIDTFAWNSGNRPGRPQGGETLGMRASFEMIRQRYADGSKPRRKTASKKRQPKA